jgi:hypothetical protein
MDKIGGRDAQILKAKSGHHPVAIGTSAQIIVWKKNLRMDEGAAEIRKIF